MKRSVEFYSEGFKLCGDVYIPEGLAPGEKRAAVLALPRVHRRKGPVPAGQRPRSERAWLRCHDLRLQGLGRQRRDYAAAWPPTAG